MGMCKLVKRFMKINKMFGLLSGLWLHQNRIVQYVLLVILYTICVSSLVTQVARVILFFSFDVVTEQCSFISVAALAFIKHINYWCHRKQYEEMFLDMQQDWQITKDEEYLAMLETYAKRAKIFIIIYTGNILACSVLFGSHPFLSLLLDIIAPLNETRKRLLVYPAHFFIDDEKYYFLELGHTLLAMLSAMIVFIACDTNYLFIVQHACGLLHIAGHRLRHAMDDENLLAASKTDSSNVTFPIKIHKRAIRRVSSRCVEQIENVYGMSLFFQMGFLIVTLTVTLVKISTMSMVENADMFIVYCGFTCTQLLHVLFLTIQGQFVENYCDQVYNLSYEAFWYNGRVSEQCLYILVLRRSLTPPSLTAGGIMPLNLKTFGEIIKASVSYFTVLQSA